MTLRPGDFALNLQSGGHPDPPRQILSDILARYGPYFLYTYTVVLGLGLVLALVMTAAWPGVGRRSPGPTARWWPPPGRCCRAASFSCGSTPNTSPRTRPGVAAPTGRAELPRRAAGGLAALGLWARLTGRSFYRAGLFRAGAGPARRRQLGGLRLRGAAPMARRGFRRRGWPASGRQSARQSGRVRPAIPPGPWA